MRELRLPDCAPLHPGYAAKLVMAVLDTAILWIAHNARVRG